MERIVLQEIFVDCLEDEVLLVKRIDELLQRIKINRERLVVVIMDEEKTILKIRKESVK